MLPPCNIRWLGLVPELVSVVLPVYNQSDMIRDAIESVLAQTYDKFELIIINDGSTDTLGSVLEPYIKHPKVRIYSQSNKGLPAALTAGFSYAKGEFWTWTSADNLMEPRQLECLSAKLRAQPELGMVYADYYAIDDRGDPVGDYLWRVQNRPDGSHRIRLPRDTSKLNLHMDNFIGACFMYRGWIGKLLGPYATAVGAEDYDYWMRISSLFSIEHLGTDDLLYRYRVHDNTLSKQADKYRIFQKVSALMDTEGIRAGYFQRPFEWICDELTISTCSEAGTMSASYEEECAEEGLYGQHLIRTSCKRIYVLGNANRNFRKYFSTEIHLYTPTVLIFNDESNDFFLKNFKDYVRCMRYSAAWVFSEKGYKNAADMGIEMIFDGRTPSEAKYATEAYFNNRIFYQATNPIVNEVSTAVRIQTINDIDKPDAAVAQRDVAVAQCDAIIASYENSKSWKLTAPLRNMAKLLNNLRR